MYLVHGLWSGHNNWYRDIVSGHCSNTLLLEKQNWQERLLNLFILKSVTHFTSSLSNIDGVKWESAALGISNSSSLSEMFLKKNGEQQSRTFQKLRKFTSWASDFMT